MTIVSHIKERSVVKFAQKTGCQRCIFLDATINGSQYGEAIQTIYLEDVEREDFHELGIMGTPLMTIVEDGEIVLRDPNVIVGEQLEEFMSKV